MLKGGEGSPCNFSKKKAPKIALGHSPMSDIPFES